MRWRGRRASGNVQDRRGMPVKGAVGGGLGMVVLVIAALVLGVDPSALLTAGGGDPAPAPGGGAAGPPPDSAGEFVAVVLADTEDTWNAIFAEGGADYPEPTLVLFDGAVRSACGMAGSAVGPFYCPRDGQVYLDLSFFRQLDRQLGAPGDFARGYVVAHEVGHHVQNVLGTGRVSGGYRDAGPESDAVRMELQADCYAGIWAHHTARSGITEPGDIEEALRAAAAIGDDTLQRRGQGQVVPETFTHGTSEQRARWFRRGYESGAPGSCDTFADPVL